MVVVGGLTPISRQDILNRHSKIGQLHIYRHAIFCKIVQWFQLLCGWQQRCPMPKTYGIVETLYFAKAYKWLYYDLIIRLMLTQCYFQEFYINQEKTLLQMDVTAAIMSLYMKLFYLMFALLWLHVCIVCNDSNAGNSCLMVLLWSVLEYYQHNLWYYIELVNVNLNQAPVSLKGTFVFWICIVITDYQSALVQQMARCRQATNHCILPEPMLTKLRDAILRQKASIG